MTSSPTSGWRSQLAVGPILDARARIEAERRDLRPALAESFASFLDIDA